jgi:hypothetical protein
MNRQKSAGEIMTAVHAEARTEEFAELDELEVIASSELKLSGAYHSYTYNCEADSDDLAKAADR